MALKDTFKNIINYFEIEDTPDQDEYAGSEAYQMANEAPKMRVANHKEKEEVVAKPLSRSQATSQNNVQRLNHRQQELMSTSDRSSKKTTIDIKFPKRYEDAPEIVNLLLDNASILIDFQYMSDTQARRCLDYLDGARSVLAGNLKKVSNTMWLLTPVNVTVNIEELRSSGVTAGQEAHFDFDMKR